MSFHLADQERFDRASTGEELRGQLQQVRLFLDDLFQEGHRAGIGPKVDGNINLTRPGPTGLRRHGSKSLARIELGPVVTVL